MNNASYEVHMVDVVNVGGSNQKFEISVGVNGVRRYDVAPGQVVQVEDGYTLPIVVVEGRMPRPSILSQLAPNMKRVDVLTEAEAATVAQLRAQHTPAPRPPAPRPKVPQQG